MKKPFLVVLPTALISCSYGYTSRRSVVVAGEERCFVDAVGANPPRTQPVNCMAPIKSPLPGERWCRVESLDGQDVPVECPIKE